VRTLASTTDISGDAFADLAPAPRAVRPWSGTVAAMLYAHNTHSRKSQRSRAESS
jgi:hypothetical protein